jgi:hypothetical protein
MRWIPQQVAQVHIKELFITYMCCSCRWGETVSELRCLTGELFFPWMIYESGEPWWNDIDRGKVKKSKKSSPSATLSTTNSTRTTPMHEPGPLW